MIYLVDNGEEYEDHGRDFVSVPDEIVDAYPTEIAELLRGGRGSNNGFLICALHEKDIIWCDGEPQARIIPWSDYLSLYSFVHWQRASYQYGPTIEPTPIAELGEGEAATKLVVKVERPAISPGLLTDLLAAWRETHTKARATFAARTDMSPAQMALHLANFDSDARTLTYLEEAHKAGRLAKK